MTRYAVVFEPEARAQLADIEAYIAVAASPPIAARFVSDIIDRCLSLHEFPLRGTPRDDLRAGLRTLVFRRRVLIGYMVQGERVRILGVAYGGRELGGVLGAN